MTELAQQIAHFRKSSDVNIAPLHHGRPSLFVDSKTAASIDISTIYESGLVGLETLQQYDVRFQVYHQSLFHSTSMSLQRELKTSAENTALDATLESFLELLSLYALESCAHNVLEYLIRRYRIHELNEDAFIRCLLPYHDTHIFVKAIELVPLKGKEMGLPCRRQAFEMSSCTHCII